jgi:hypothetical protein
MLLQIPVSVVQGAAKTMRETRPVRDMPGMVNVHIQDDVIPAHAVHVFKNCLIAKSILAVMLFIK